MGNEKNYMALGKWACIRKSCYLEEGHVNELKDLT